MQKTIKWENRLNIFSLYLYYPAYLAAEGDPVYPVTNFWYQDVKFRTLISND